MSDLETRFYQGIWKWIPDDDDSTWVLNRAASDRGRTEQHDLIRDLLQHGVPPDLIARFSKIVAYEMAFRILYYMDDFSADNNGDLEDDPDLSWHMAVLRDETNLDKTLFVDAASLIEHDPTGREMQPKTV